MENDYILNLTQISEEEKAILNGSLEVEKSIYTSNSSFSIESKKLLNDKLIDIRVHTRFIDFPMHSHDYMEMMYVYSGSIIHHFQKEKVVLNKGDIILMNKFCRHEIEKASKDDIGINFIISDSFLSSVFKDLSKEEVLFTFLEHNYMTGSKEEYLVFHVENIKPIQNLIDNMLYFMSDKGTPDKILIDSISLLFNYLSFYNESLYNTYNINKDIELKREIEHYIKTNYKNASLEELSNKYSFTVEYMSRKIKFLFNKTFKELLVDERMEISLKLLKESDMNINDIIHYLGYENKSYFHKKFKELFGLTPLKWRNEK